MAKVKKYFFSKVIELEKNMLNYFNKLYNNKEENMNPPRSGIAERGS
jgi:hypothetical protein